MITNNELKTIKSLKFKKYRDKFSLFIAEGYKIVNELYHSKIHTEEIYSTINYEKINSKIINELEMKKISSLKSPSKILGVFKIPKNNEKIFGELILCLDNISDPGNLGSIIRLCDWFNIKSILCSFNTVDCYNPKVIQASMGSISRVSCYYFNILEFLKKSNKKIYGAFLDNSSSIYSTDFERNSIIVIGSESTGISNEISKLIENRITIPRFNNNKYPESFNINSAVSIILSEFYK